MLLLREIFRNMQSAKRFFAYRAEWFFKADKAYCEIFRNKLYLYISFFILCAACSFAAAEDML